MNNKGCRELSFLWSLINNWLLKGEKMQLKKIMLPAVLSCALFSNIAFAESDPFVEHLDRINERLASEGQNVVVHSMELIGSGEGLNMGRTVFASDHGNKQLGIDWALNDPNRLDVNGNPRTNITYAVDTAEFSADFPDYEQPGIVRTALETWDEEKCSNIGIDEVLAPTTNLGLLAGDMGFLGAAFGADIIHGGFKSPANFDNLICGAPGSGCGNGILGVTFTLAWVIGTEFTDYDNNGRLDAATREIYYNDGFTWANDGTGEIGSGVYDFATVALHESGHALSRAHFGDVSIHHKKGLQTSPKAVMNAIYSGVQRELSGPDKGGHCSDWAAWPNQS